MVPGKIDNEKKGSSNNLSFQLVADQKFLAKKQEIKDLGSMMKKRSIAVKDESIKKGIEFIRPSHGENANYVTISEGYQVIMFFNEVITEKLLKGFDFNDELIEQTYADHEYNKMKMKSPVKNFDFDND